MEKRYISVKELSEYIGIKVQTIYNWTYARKIPYHKFGNGIVRFDLKDIERFLSSAKVKETGGNPT